LINNKEELIKKFGKHDGKDEDRFIEVCRIKNK